MPPAQQRSIWTWCGRLPVAEGTTPARRLGAAPGMPGSVLPGGWRLPVDERVGHGGHDAAGYDRPGGVIACAEGQGAVVRQPVGVGVRQLFEAADPDRLARVLAVEQLDLHVGRGARVVEVAGGQVDVRADLRSEERRVGREW